MITSEPGLIALLRNLPLVRLWNFSISWPCCHSLLYMILLKVIQFLKMTLKTFANHLRSCIGTCFVFVRFCESPKELLMLQSFRFFGFSCSKMGLTILVKILMALMFFFIFEESIELFDNEGILSNGDPAFGFLLIVYNRMMYLLPYLLRRFFFHQSLFLLMSGKLGLMFSLMP